MTTDDLKDRTHIVVIEKSGAIELFVYDGDGCMERAHDFAVKAAFENRDAVVHVAMRYRMIIGPDAPI